MPKNPSPPGPRAPKIWCLKQRRKGVGRISSSPCNKWPNQGGGGTHAPLQHRTKSLSNDCAAARVHKMGASLCRESVLRAPPPLGMVCASFCAGGALLCATQSGASARTKVARAYQMNGARTKILQFSTRANVSARTKFSYAYRIRYAYQIFGKRTKIGYAYQNWVGCAGHFGTRAKIWYAYHFATRVPNWVRVPDLTRVPNFGT